MTSARRARARRRTPRRMWHGGYPHLRPGQLLLPPATTGNDRQHRARARMATVPGIDMAAFTPDDTDPGWVHFSPHRHVALAFAATSAHQYGHGALYAVEPDPATTEPDPDLPVTSLRARSARIVAVAEPHVLLTTEDAVLLHAQLLATERGRPVGEMMAQMVAAAEQARAALDAAGLTYDPTS